MKPRTFNPTSSAWNKFRAKTNNRARGLMFAVALIMGVFILGAIAQPETGAGAGATLAAASLVALPFAKRQGSLERMYKDDPAPPGAGMLSAEAEKSILDKVKEVVKAQIDSLAAKGLPPDKQKAFDDFFAGDLSKAKTMADLQTMSAQLEELGLKMISSQEKAKGERAPGFFSALKTAWADSKSEIDAIVSSGGKMEKPLIIDIKAAIVMGEDNTIGSGTTQTSNTTFTGIISIIRQRILTYLQNVSVGSTTSKIVYWIEETDPQGTPIFIGEGDSKTQLSIKYVEQTATVKKIAVYGKVTTEMMADLGQLISYIKNNLMKRMDIVVEEQLFTGNNVGDNLQGVIPLATAFSAPASLALQVPGANEYDVLEAIALQSKLAYGLPNVTFINPVTRTKMLLLKDTMGQYIYPRWASPDAMTVAGMRIVESVTMAEGDFVGGDFTVVNVLIREGVTIQIGLDGNDFTNNVKTILMEQRLVQFVSANDVQVLVKGSFATAKAALVEPT